MTIDAQQLLAKLLNDGERVRAGVRSRAARLTEHALEPYRRSASLAARECFEGVMQNAESVGAIRLTRDHGLSTGVIRSVELVDLDKLAEFTGATTQESKLAAATATLEPWMDTFPVLNDVLERWRLLGKVRKSTPDNATDWLHAARVVSAMHSDTTVRVADLPVREVSARLLRDSKKIERITGLIDVLLVGDVGAVPREPREVWAELGLRREEQPVRLAGQVVIKRQRVTAMLDAPYGAFPPSTVLGITSPVEKILTIENLTTFQTEAVSRCEQPALLIYTAGTPSPAWCAMYERLLADVPAQTPLLHWGDIDEGGFRIAAQIASVAAKTGRRLEPYRMEPELIPVQARHPASDAICQRMRRFACSAGWPELGARVAAAGFTVEQEAI